MDLTDNQKYLSVAQVAALFKALPPAVLAWIEDGSLDAIKQEDGTYLIPIDAYEEFGHTRQDLWQVEFEKFMVLAIEEMRPAVQRDVADRFRQSNEVVLDRAQQAVNMLESLHKKYEPLIEIYERRGAVASFIVYARVISLLYSTIKLLRSGVPAESFILFRPLWEAVLLALYFWLSEAKGDNQSKILKWFDSDISPQSKHVRHYVSKSTAMNLRELDEKSQLYSKPIHHTYRVIMESYRGFELSGCMGSHKQRNGFDYHTSSIMRDVVSLVMEFEGLLGMALTVFYLCFSRSLALNDIEVKTLKAEKDFYALDRSERLSMIREELGDDNLA